MLTYGDGLTNQNLNKLEKFHLRNRKVATMTIVRPPVRFGEVKISGSLIKKFKEKPQITNSWINGGFFVLKKSVINKIETDSTLWEQEPLTQLAKEGNLIAYKHSDFWHPMDTMRDKNHLENLWETDKAPWKIW